MKTLNKIILLVFCQLVVVTGYSQQLLNGGFEETYLDYGTNPTGDLKATYWWFGGSVYCDETLGSISNDSHSGDWALKMETISCGWGNVAGMGGNTSQIPGAITVPEVISHTINSRPDQLSFYYKFEPIEGDTARLRALLFNYPEGITLLDPYAFLAIDTVAFIDYFFIESTEEYTNKTINFQYESSDIAAYISLDFRSNKNAWTDPQFNSHGHEGTSLFIDDVELIYLTTALENPIKTNEVKLFPNPAEEHFSIDLPGNTTINSVSILDFSGRVVNIQASKNGMYSLNGLSTGMYFVQIETDKGSVVKKVVKE
jgi:hypothetical protein